MEDLSKDMMPGKPVSPKMRALLDKEKKETRARIIERGIVHFRADKEFMTALLEAADQLKIAPGTLCRRIVWEHLKPVRPGQSIEHVELSPEISQALIRKLEAIQDLLAQIMPTLGAQGKSPIDVASLANELKTGQEEIRGELREIHAYLTGKAKGAKRRSI
ncbi:MAG TPA: hypothetical protein V6D08_09935 [Candidatus Obscuribacterales bacterium]